ncbi:unnamed protein product [Rotaria magnacalcarata]|uniref:Uncharacterized protein n=1 Tax=Rotaria magnacalcarata TaxID=392030 RepID=A0A819CPU1_9BILA|nr:unnamed protein product [Rotaria magnacalcarata]CAF2046524.1 unnamed protein product [Rotaria magnacalcarata]CAF3819137.1 unnamed protein product [Rotaria magnacalcarata]CAF3863423.1 unnamed protein product [Rotaria magnacalcarata]
MTVLPFLDIKATPVRSLESPRLSRTKSFPHTTEFNGQQSSPGSRRYSDKLSSSSPIRSLIPSARICTPKIKIVARSDEILKQLPHQKTANVQTLHSIWKPLTREQPDYDYLWEPVQREDIRHQYDTYKAPDRIIASRPDEQVKMTTMFETEDRHYHNYKRVQAMQQRQWNQQHMQYTIYPYSHMEEREMYNKQIRSTLKEQMEHKIQADKIQIDMKNRATEIVMEQDRKDIEQEKQRQIDRAKFLLHFTVKNKELMESKWEYDNWNRTHQWHVERAVLADTPINWSKTMT